MSSTPPIVVGGHLALDLLNTVVAPQGQPIEFLPNGAALLDWLVATGVLDGDEARIVRRRFPGPALEATARKAVLLREWLRPIVNRSASRGAASPSATELRHLNDLLAREIGVLEVVPSGRGFTTRVVRRWASATDLLAPVIAAIADLFTVENFHLVRGCAGPSCTLWFLDRTKGHRRRWCAMEVCGNRAKVGAHRRRTRPVVGKMIDA